MKRVTLLLIGLAMVHTGLAQQWKLTLGTDSKALYYNRNYSVDKTGFIGGDSNRFYLLQRSVMDKHPTVVCYDGGMNVLNRKVVTEGSKCTVYGGYVNRNSVDLLMTESSGKVYRAYRLSYDPKTLEPKEQPVLLNEIQTNDRTKAYTFVSSSQSQEWTGAFFAVVDGENAEWRVNLYDMEISEMWSMEFQMDAVDDFFVTDSGEIVVASFMIQEERGMTRLRFAVLDGEREQAFTSHETLPELQNMEIVRYERGKVYCVGLLKGEEQSDNGKWHSGFYSLVYDTKGKRVEYFGKVDFTKEDVCDLCNVSRRMRLKTISTDKLYFADARYDASGTTVAYERSFNFYLNGVFTYTDNCGILLFRIDNEGRIIWHTIASRDVQAPAEIANSVQTRLIPSGDGYTIFYIDHPSNQTLEQGQPAKVTSVDKSKQVLMALRVDHKGNVSRQSMAVPSKAICIGSPHYIAEGRYLQVFCQPFKANIGILRYE